MDNLHRLIAIASNLPEGKPIATETVLDREAIIWYFYDNNWREYRKAYFALDNGEYLGDTN